MNNLRVTGRLGCSYPAAALERSRWLELEGWDSVRTSIGGRFIRRYVAKRPDKPLVRIRTRTGREVVGSEDHPFYTPDGYRKLGTLRKGDRVAVSSYEGIPHEDPDDDVLVDERRIRDLLADGRGRHRGSRVGQVVAFLKRRNLLPLRRCRTEAALLARILGFLTGDGTANYIGGDGKGRAAFYGSPEDLEEIRRDIQAVGFTPSRVYVREREHRIRTDYARFTFQRSESFFHVTSTAFVALLQALGAPIGRKTDQDFRVPKWIRQGPRWHQRLYLAAYFGAELTSPKSFRKAGKNFYTPLLATNRWPGHVESGKRFLEDISEMLQSFGVQTLKISEAESYTLKDGRRSIRLRLVLGSRPENLVNLWTRIGFDYQQGKRAEGLLAAAYLRFKEAFKEEPFVLRDVVSTYGAAAVAAGGWDVIAEPVYERVPTSFPSFAAWRERATSGLGNSGLFWDEIVSLEPYEPTEEDRVFDITVDSADRNFIAGGFLVHNCGVRLMRSNLDHTEMGKSAADLVNGLFASIPTGVGSHRRDFRLSVKEEKQVAREGARWAVRHGYGSEEDLRHIEEGGRIPDADPDAVSDRAIQRGLKQLGTLGSGNHFTEVGYVDEVYDEEAAGALGLHLGQVTVMVHTGSRGFGYQVCDDSIKMMLEAARKYGISLPDRQLCCAPLKSKEGRRYLAAMACAANYAFANRQMITHFVRETFEEVLGIGPREHGLSLVYDVCHNIGKFENHMVGGEERRVFVHRKGATRAFPPGHRDVPEAYRSVGQPVLIPGDMGRYSFVLVGTQKAYEETWGSTCHGAGRRMSRKEAKREARSRNVPREMERRGIHLRAAGRATVDEEMPEAYKDVASVVDACHEAGISRKVARLRPMAVIKG